MRFILLIFCFCCLQAKSSAYNFTDDKGQRQGYWILFGHMVNEEGYSPDQKVEEGNYVDNKRQGLWKKYYPTGALRSEIHYVNNQPNGAYKLYYSNGILEESSTWKNAHHVGAFERYHENGEIAQRFMFSEWGKRNGLQEYYHENGQLKMAVEISNGTENGFLKRYNKRGELLEEMRFQEGKPDPQSIKRYKPSEPLLAQSGPGSTASSARASDIGTPANSGVGAPRDVNDTPNLSRFNETGYNTLYNKSRQITQVGEFRRGKLWDGRWHRYDGNGILKKIEIYKEGRLIGYAPLEEADR